MDRERRRGEHDADMHARHERDQWRALIPQERRERREHLCAPVPVQPPLTPQRARVQP